MDLMGGLRVASPEVRGGASLLPICFTHTQRERERERERRGSMLMEKNEEEDGQRCRGMDGWLHK